MTVTLSSCGAIVYSNVSRHCSLPKNGERVFLRLQVTARLLSLVDISQDPVAVKPHDIITLWYIFLRELLRVQCFTIPTQSGVRTRRWEVIKISFFTNSEVFIDDAEKFIT